MSLVYKTRKWSHSTLFRGYCARSCHWNVFFIKEFFFPGDDIFVALKIDWKNSSSSHIFCNMRSLMCEKRLRFPSPKILLYYIEIYSLLQEILLAAAPICVSSFEHQSDKLNFAFLPCCFCQSTSFSPAGLLTEVFLYSQE